MRFLILFFLGAIVYGQDTKTQIIQNRLQLKDHLILEDQVYHLQFAGPFYHDRPWICFSGHEMAPAIIFDPSNTPLLEKACFELQKMIEERGFDIPSQILGFCLDFVVRRLFSEEKQTLEGILGVEASLYYKTIPLVPLEHYVKAKIGMCKQQSLVYLYLVGKIFPTANLTFHRGIIQVGGEKIGHAWTEIGLEKKRYLVDPGLRLVLDFDKDHALLTNIYGEALGQKEENCGDLF